ncbi:MAG: hypothetical protein E4H33_00915 [Anaerolineales bacterium]|nr:MAG: hypothetical protein E4H33_00915 [Anaerolineales bacterium]
MQKIQVVLLITGILFSAGSCNLPAAEDDSAASDIEQGIIPLQTFIAADYDPGEVPESDLIQPEDLVYRGFFRLPGPSGGSDWDYSGHGLTYFPAGDPAGELDGYPGSLFGFGHDHQLFVSEISIPAPVITENLDEAQTATTMQPFADLTGGIFDAEDMIIPRAGLEYLAEPAPRLHFTFGQHIQDFEASHGWAGLDLAHPDAQGPWVFDGYTNYVTNDYLFEIPPDWAQAIAQGPLLASGRAREGFWSGRGPGLFAYQPGDVNNPLAAGEVLPSVLPLLLYGEQNTGEPDIISTPSQAVEDYHEADHWWGGAWLTAERSAAVVFAGTKALGEEWYGFANGVVWEHDCADQTPPTCPDVPEWPYDNRGFWAEAYQAQLIFYDPSQLVSVANGEINSWEPQPYATLVLDDYLLDPSLDYGEYKRDLVGALAFDRDGGFLYLIERLADEYKSVIHVWEITR